MDRPDGRSICVPEVVSGELAPRAGVTLPPLEPPPCITVHPGDAKVRGFTATKEGRHDYTGDPHDFSAAQTMSVEAISWALNEAPVDSPTSKLVLIALANHARPDGTAAFPSVETISRYTCLSERAIRQHLDLLERSGVIRRCDPAIVAAYIRRSDRRPIGYDLCLHGVQEMHLGGSRGAGRSTHGVQDVPSRGAGDAPEPYKEPYRENRPSFMSEADAPDPLPAVLADSPYLDDARRLCQLLADLMVANGSKAPTITTTWVAEMDRLMRIDERTPVQVEAAIRWSQGHDFWRANIHSPTKLRAKYDQLRLQAQRDAQRAQPRGFNAIREFLTDDRRPVV